MIQVTEATFARRVLRAEGPVLVCFGARACPGLRAMRPALARVGAAHAGRLQIATVLLDRAPLLAEQYGVHVSPTLMVFAGGERQGQAVGFLPEGLLELLADEAARGLVAGDRFWSPVEERLEDAVLIPLLASQGLGVRRQVACALPGAQRGRVDLLVDDGPGGPPLTLVESKRQIRGDDELQRAALQAAAYARALGLGSFVVAAPRGLWLYRCDGAGFRCLRHLSSLELAAAPEQLAGLLRQLGAGASAGHEQPPARRAGRGREGR